MSIGFGRSVIFMVIDFDFFTHTMVSKIQPESVFIILSNSKLICLLFRVVTLPKLCTCNWTLLARKGNSWFVKTAYFIARMGRLHIHPPSLSLILGTSCTSSLSLSRSGSNMKI